MIWDMWQRQQKRKKKNNEDLAQELGLAFTLHGDEKVGIKKLDKLNSGGIQGDSMQCNVPLVNVKGRAAGEPNASKEPCFVE